MLPMLPEENEILNRYILTEYKSVSEDFNIYLDILRGVDVEITPLFLKRYTEEYDARKALLRAAYMACCKYDNLLADPNNPELDPLTTKEQEVLAMAYAAQKARKSIAPAKKF